LRVVRGNPLGGIEPRAGDGEDVDDFSGVVVTGLLVDRPGRMKFDQSLERGGQTGKGETGSGGFHRWFFQWSRSTGKRAGDR
jgi:hypothetical protein